MTNLLWIDIMFAEIVIERWLAPAAIVAKGTKHIFNEFSHGNKHIKAAAYIMCLCKSSSFLQRLCGVVWFCIFHATLIILWSPIGLSSFCGSVCNVTWKKNLTRNQKETEAKLLEFVSKFLRVHYSMMTLNFSEFRIYGTQNLHNHQFVVITKRLILTTIY